MGASLGRYGAYLPAKVYAARSFATRAEDIGGLSYGALRVVGNAPGDLTIPELLLFQTSPLQ
ncbi:hypothetical protein ACVWWN_001730 [Mycobacterium sp. URHB0021]